MLVVTLLRQKRSRSYIGSQSISWRYVHTFVRGPHSDGVTVQRQVQHRNLRRRTGFRRVLDPDRTIRASEKHSTAMVVQDGDRFVRLQKGLTDFTPFPTERELTKFVSSVKVRANLYHPIPRLGLLRDFFPPRPADPYIQLPIWQDLQEIRRISDYYPRNAASWYHHLQSGRHGIRTTVSGRA